MYVWHSGHHVTEPAWVLRLLTGVFDFARIVQPTKDLLSGIAKWIICFMMYAVITMFMMCHSSKFYWSNDSYMYVCIWFVFWMSSLLREESAQQENHALFSSLYVCILFLPNHVFDVLTPLPDAFEALSEVVVHKTIPLRGCVSMSILS